MPHEAAFLKELEGTVQRLETKGMIEPFCINAAFWQFLKLQVETLS